MADFKNFLKNSVIVAAHPDDEMLWFGSILEQTEQVIVVFEDFWPDPALGPARARAIANHPHPNIVSYQIAEAATYGCANWQRPVLSREGIKLERKADLRDAKQQVKRWLGRGARQARNIRQAYRANFYVLVEKLRLDLKPDMNVFTHNPWGEYGHEDHIQVFRALDMLRAEIGFTLWMSNYCTERAQPLAMTYFENCPDQFVQLPCNKPYCDAVADVYREAGCWTWSDNWRWFDTECFMEAPHRQSSTTDQRHLFPMNMFNIEPVVVSAPENEIKPFAAAKTA